MKRTYQKVPTRFGKDTRFEVKATQVRAAATTELERLKERLLGAMLREATDEQRGAALRQASNDAAALAWATSFPLLFFPTLLEEHARAALNRQQLQQTIKRRSRSLALTAL